MAQAGYTITLFNRGMEAIEKPKGIRGLKLTPLTRPFYSAPLMHGLQATPLSTPPEETYRQRFLQWAEGQEPGFRDYLLSLTESQQVRKLA